MDFKQINEEIEHFLELYPENAGLEITDFKDYDDAINKIKQKCDNNEILAYCPNAVTVDYQGKQYSLAVVLGVRDKMNTGMNPHGMAHYMDKHTYEYEKGTIPTDAELLQATKNVKNALKQAEHDRKVVYNPFEHKLIFQCGQYIYVICLAKDDKELAYLHNLFIPKNPNYLKKKQKEVDKQKQKEIPPYKL